MSEERKLEEREEIQNHNGAGRTGGLGSETAPGGGTPSGRAQSAADVTNGRDRGLDAGVAGAAFEKAAAFGTAVSGGGDGRAEEIYLWEHGVAVEPWPEPVSGKDLLDGLEWLMGRFVFLPRWAAETLALWVVHTYAFHLRLVATYIGLESPEKRCGKTTLLTVLCELVNRPVVASNISSPAFFRVIAEKRPTLMIDEADTVLHRNKELKGILNAGCAKKTGYVIRMASRKIRSRTGLRQGPVGDEGKVHGLIGEGVEAGAGRDGNGEGGVSDAGSDGLGRESGLQLARFSSWCPKAIATIKHLPETLADRCIVIPMQRKAAREQCERLRNLKGTEWRRKCARFVMDHAAEIAGAQPEIPADLNDRAADIWEPLLALADLAGGEWPEKARNAALGLTAIAQEESPIGALLLDLLVVFARQRCADGSRLEDGGARIFSRDLVACLNLCTDRPWLILRKGKVLTETWMSQQLRPYGVRPKTIWIGEKSAKGYVEGDFTDVFRRYIPKSAMLALLEESGASRANGAEKPKAETQNKSP